LYIEYNVVQQSPLNEKVLREKRRKLKETFDRVMKMYVSTMPNLSLRDILRFLVFLFKFIV